MIASGMRVVFLSVSAEIGGAERSLLDLLSSLRRSQPGWDLTLIAPDHGPLVSEARSQGIAVHVLRFPDRVSAMGDSAAGGPAGRTLGKAILLLRMIGAAGAVQGYLRSLRRLLRTLEPTLIHSNGLKMHVLMSWAKPAGVPVVDRGRRLPRRRHRLRRRPDEARGAEPARLHVDAAARCPGDRAGLRLPRHVAGGAHFQLHKPGQQPDPPIDRRVLDPPAPLRRALRRGRIPADQRHPGGGRRKPRRPADEGRDQGHPAADRGDAPAAGAGGLTALTPARILDTRNGTGGISGPVASDHSISLNVEGVGGVPASGVSAVVLNVTATAPSANGHLTVYPDGASVPSTSNLNFSAGETVPNLVIAPVGSDGKVDFYNGSGGTVQVLADVSGWFASGAAAAGGLTPLTPARILDTRNGTGGISGPVASDHSISLNVEGVGGVPASGVSAVVLNVTATAPSANGHLTVYPDGASVPSTSNLNFSAGETVPNLVIAPVGSDGKVDFYNGSGGTVQVLADVSGWFASGSAAAGGLTALTPARILDTRNGTGGISGPVASDHSISLNVEGVGGVPASGVSAVVLNVTATAPSANGHLTVYPDGASVPSTSNLNFSAGETVPNLVIAPVGSDGKVDFYNGSGGTVQVLADVSGWFSGTSASTAVKQVASDGQGFCAVLFAGGLDCWGVNDEGELGNGTFSGPDGEAGYDTPQAVTGITNAVSATSNNAGLGYCALLSTGRVDCWGDNTWGEIGNGTTVGEYDTPQAVTGITNAVSVVSGGQGYDYCAVLSTGGVDCWGLNSDGELGDGNIGGPDGLNDGYDTPQAVIGITKAISLSGDGTGDGGYCAVLSTGGVDCWGANTFGELGNGTTGGPDVGPVGCMATTRPRRSPASPTLFL